MVWEERELRVEEYDWLYAVLDMALGFRVFGYDSDVVRRVNRGSE